MLGTGLGILRGDQTDAAGAVLDDARRRTRKVLEKRLLIITKANSRATVHRSAYLDYIGFKIFDADGKVVGERRFLGLFSSRRLPHQRARAAGGRAARSPRCSTAPACRPRSHSGKDLMEILETYPRDELFQITTDDLYRGDRRAAAWPAAGSCGCSCAATRTAGSSPA